ncbi:hypothetical protein K438DRAFT_1930034 [Mycena galopus ATCC 62051]|nr:hypothetical protein K438DRAFT_1930034 [Mycena galopus ATCC 62051]
MKRKDNTRSTSNENNDPRPNPRARVKPSRAPTTSSARAPLRDRNVTTNEEGQTISPSPLPKPESTCIARLEAELEAMKAQRDHADAALCAERQRAPVTRREHEPAADESIPRPPNAAKVKMEALQQMLDLEKMEWNAIHTATRDALTAAQLDMERKWKAQKPSKLAMAYNALTYLEVEERFPVLRQCEGQWGVDRIAKQTLSNRKSYQSCVQNPSTYRGRRAEARRTTVHRAAVRVAAARRTSSHTPPATPSPIAAPSPRRSPSAGPSQPRRHAQPQRILSFDGDDDLMNFDDDLQDNGDEGDEPELSASEGKKRAAPPDGQSRKRSRRD